MNIYLHVNITTTIQKWLCHTYNALFFVDNNVECTFRDRYFSVRQKQKTKAKKQHSVYVCRFTIYYTNTDRVLRSDQVLTGAEVATFV
jgi:hypothetical protein